MSDLAEGTSQDGEPGPAPQPIAEAAPQPQPEPAKRPPDTAAGTGETPALDTQEEDEAILGAEDLAESIRLRRQMRQAGLESLGRTWFSGVTRFGAPASFGGHAAARDVNIYYGTTERTTLEAGPIGREILQRIQSVHVASNSYVTTERVIRKERVVVLRGADGSGKRTTALFLLSKLADYPVHAVSPELVLGPSAGSELQERVCYLAESPVAAELAFTRLAALSVELTQRDAYLVVTVPTGTLADADTAEHFIVDHEPSDCHEIVRRHLRVDADHARDAELLLQGSSALACVTSPGVAAELAARLLAIVKNGRPSDELGPILADIRRRRARHLLRISRPEGPRERVELLCRRAALVSVAVFTGLPYADAVAAAETLAAWFIAIEFPKSKGREIFIPWRERLLAELDIVIEEAELPGRWGPTVTQQLRFRDSEFPMAVLEEVWEHYDAVRSPLLQWLRELAVSSRDEAIRIRAAQVAGRLAVRDFSHVCHRLLLEWADSINGKAQESAATALEAAAVSMASQVWELLAEWCKDGNQNRQRTAVLALGTRISEHAPDETLGRLRQLALRNTGRSAQTMSEAVRRSVAELFTGPHQAAVVRALRSWANNADLRLRAVARRCLPPLAHMADDSGRPSLLLALLHHPSLRADVVVLVAAALEETDTSQETWTALERLATATASDPALTEELGKLLAELQRSSNAVKKQLRFYLLLWANRHPELTYEFRTTAREVNRVRQ